MPPPAAATAPLPRPSRVVAILLAIVVAGTSLAASGLPNALTIEPRIVEATLGRVSLEQVDVSLQVALRASQAATIRSIAFTDAFVGQVPVWIERLDGDWPLAAGQELVLPERVQVRIHARDAVGAGDLGALIRRRSVTVRATVEVAVETPRLARMLFMGATRTLVRDVAVEMPVQFGTSSLGSLALIGADLVDAAQRGGGGGWLASGLNQLPARSGLVQRFGASVAGVTTRYAIDGGGSPGTRERRAAGAWWTPAVFCTTREALEPWRFDAADATDLQLGGSQLRREGGAVSVAATREHPALTIDLASLDRLLPSPDERKLYALVDGRRRPMRLADRTAESNLVCLQVADAPAPITQHAVTTNGNATTDVAAFSPGPPLVVLWTSVAPRKGDRLEIGTPLHRGSFGSLVVSGDRVLGLVASPTTAWTAAIVDAAAARAPRLPGAAPAVTVRPR